MVAICAVAAPDSAVWDWLATAGATVVTPDRAAILVVTPELAAPASPGIPTIACLPVRDLGQAIGVDPAVGLRADAYASTAPAFAEAVRHVLAEDRAARDHGPLRLTWLGALGWAQPSPAIGAAFVLRDGAAIRAGRSPTCEIAIPQGHSDQSNVARLHAVITRTDTEVRVRDAQSTNGTFIRGVKIDGDTALAPGEELALAGRMRLRLDGRPDGPISDPRS